jgi:pimeloyl-ACP methyl ester carboxylesterase
MLMRYSDEGSGPPVVLVHSGVCDRRMWRPQVEALRASYRVVAPDLRGFGETPLPGERFGFDTDLVALLDALELEEVTLVGSSLGGRVVTEVAATHPDRVSQLVLLCAAGRYVDPTPDFEEFDAAEEALLEAGDVEGAVALNVETWLGLDADADVRRLVHEMQRHAFAVQLAADQADPAPELTRVDVDPARITARTLVVSGDLDLEFFGAVAQHLAGTIPGARHVRLPWAKHLPSLERPDEVTALIRDFLA